MGKIYSSAQKTIIWLGPGQETDKSTFRRARFGALLYRTKEHLPNRLDGIFRKTFHPFTSKPSHLSAFQPLCANPWFSRIWTLQECFLGRHPTLQSDHLQLSLSDFAEYWLFLDITQGSPFAKATPHCFSRISSLIITTHFRSLAGTITKHRKEPLVTDVRAHVDNWWSFRKALPYFLHQAAFANTATDPRDKVYALLPILSRFLPEFSAFPADYTAPVAHVYESFTRFLVSQTHRLGFFDLLYPKTPSVQGLPPWVLDVGGDTSGSLFVLVGGAMCFYAAGESEVDIPLFEASPPGELHLRGARFSRVAIISEEIPKEMDLMIDVATKYIGWLWETLPSTMPGEERARVGAELLVIVKNKPVMDRLKEGGRFYLTEGWNVGISQFEIAEGDEVVVMAGGDLPLVLRRWEDGKSVFMGPTVVMGTHDGEFWGRERLVEELDAWEVV
ncbi:hypothetical protein B0T14DRAFT_570386 [Immersiella caudata]|uniref:Heterokaryon incompatibility domain-containing protein n=1 Tax=Immersiella caudata TaxID=314043 RepID=A0AA40BUV9_9PEZI|nr:hypothetical protein B0T14DRAFT_570386 [Immersiella caudata]